MKTTLEHVGCGRFPVSSLAALAGLRRSEGISVLIEGDWCWAFWEPGNDRALQSLFPIEGVELFERRSETWYRLGRRLPAFEVPDSDQAVTIDRLIFPGTFQVVNPGESSLIPAKLRLVRDLHQRPSTASLGPLVEVGRWAESAPASAIEAVQGAIRGDQALLLGSNLPFWPGSTRYWGERVLVPIGFQVRPNLPEEAILRSLDASGLELLRVSGDDGASDGAAVELIPYAAFRPLTRAGVRLALRARSS